jgi:RNA-directed DNA polymerase
MDANRRASHEHERFDFLGYTFRPRPSKSKDSNYFAGFTLAVSTLYSRRSARRSDDGAFTCAMRRALTELARSINPIAQGWITYYGAFRIAP